MANSQNKVVTRLLLSVDSSIHNRPGFIYAKQFDSKSRFIDVTLMNSSGIIPVSGLAQLNATRPDGEKIYVPGTINADFTISFSLKSQVLALPGNVVCDVSIFGAEGTDQITLTSSTFNIVVAESQLSVDAWEGEDDTNVFTEAIATVAGHAAQASASAQEAKSSADSAKASEVNAAASKEATEQNRLEIEGLKDEIDKAGAVIKDDIATATDLLDQAISENRNALALCEETKEYRDEAATHKDGALGAKEAAEAAQQAAEIARDAAKESELNAAASEANAEQSASRVAESIQVARDLEAEISEAGAKVKEDLASATVTLSQAQEVSAAAMNSAEEIKTYRNEAKAHAEAAEAAKVAAATSEVNAKASAESAATHDANTLQTEERVNELLVQATQKANDAKDSADEAADTVTSVQEVAQQVSIDAKLAQDKAEEAEASAQNAAQSEASAKGHADTIQETVDTLADDYQAVVEEVRDLKTRIQDASIRPSDLSLQYNASTGTLFPAYMGDASTNGWKISDVYAVATLEEARAYLSN